MSAVLVTLLMVSAPLVEGVVLWRVWALLIAPYVAGAPTLSSLPFVGLTLTCMILRFRPRVDPEASIEQRTAHLIDSVMKHYILYSFTLIVTYALSLGVGQ